MPVVLNFMQTVNHNFKSTRHILRVKVIALLKTIYNNRHKQMKGHHYVLLSSLRSLQYEHFGGVPELGATLEVGIGLPGTSKG